MTTDSRTCIYCQRELPLSLFAPSRKKKGDFNKTRDPCLEYKNRARGTAQNPKVGMRLRNFPPYTGP